MQNPHPHTLARPTLIRLRPALAPLPMFRPRLFAAQARPAHKGRGLIRLIGTVIAMQIAMPLACLLGADGFAIYCFTLCALTLCALALGVRSLFRR